MLRTQTNFTTAYVVLIAALFAVPAWTADDAKAKPVEAPKAEEVSKLIEQLGDEKFEVREAATEKLKTLGEAAHPALKETLKKEKLDPEVASRIQKLLNPTPKAVASATDAATGITVSLENGGTSLCATKDQKKIWEVKMGGQTRGETVSIANGQVTVQPCGWVVDLATGKVLMVRRNIQMLFQGGAIQIQGGR